MDCLNKSIMTDTSLRTLTPDEEANAKAWEIMHYPKKFFLAQQGNCICMGYMTKKLLLDNNIQLGLTGTNVALAIYKDKSFLVNVGNGISLHDDFSLNLHEDGGYNFSRGVINFPTYQIGEKKYFNFSVINNERYIYYNGFLHSLSNNAKILVSDSPSKNEFVHNNVTYKYEYGGFSTLTPFVVDSGIKEVILENSNVAPIEYKLADGCPSNDTSSVIRDEYFGFIQEKYAKINEIVRNDNVVYDRVGCGIIYDGNCSDYSGKGLMYLPNMNIPINNLMTYIRNGILEGPNFKAIYDSIDNGYVKKYIDDEIKYRNSKYSYIVKNSTLLSIKALIGATAAFGAYKSAQIFAEKYPLTATVASKAASLAADASLFTASTVLPNVMYVGGMALNLAGNVHPGIPLVLYAGLGYTLYNATPDKALSFAGSTAKVAYKSTKFIGGGLASTAKDALVGAIGAM